MLYIVYKTTCIINNKFYIGSHKTNDVNDGYIGSGIIFWRAVEKYGKENFKREVHTVFDNKKEMFDLEHELVAKEKSNPLCYNIKEGGCGGFDFINENGLSGHRKGSEKAIQRKAEILKEDPEYFKKKQRDALKANSPWAKKLKEQGKTSKIGKRAFKGRKHTQEIKDKIGRKAIARNTVGARNSQYETYWINNEMEAKKIKKTELQSYLDNGWIKGRKGFMKLTKGKVGERVMPSVLKTDMSC